MTNLLKFSRRLYRKAGQFNLYFHFYRDEQMLDVPRLKREIEGMRQAIVEIEEEIDKHTAEY